MPTVLREPTLKWLLVASRTEGGEKVAHPSGLRSGQWYLGKLRAGFETLGERW